MSRHARSSSSLLPAIFAFLCAFGGSAARAAIYKVGADADCSQTSIAAAIAVAQAHPDSIGDVIEVAENRDMSSEADTFTITMAVGKRLEIRGGFDNCGQALGNGGHAVINGAGGVSGPVFDIASNTNGVVTLTHLTIRGGDTAGSGKGGGIHFRGLGDGTLRLDDCSVTQNSAGYGGGIYAEMLTPSPPDASAGFLVIGRDVDIDGNTASFDGGGIVVAGTQLTMTESGSYIASNHAPNGYGGGLLVWAGTKSTVANLASTGLGNLGMVYLNNAARGGGIAVMASDSAVAQLNLFSVQAQPVRINSNTASLDGGGIYLGRAGGAFGQSKMSTGNVYIQNNVAPHGAAISVRESAGANYGVFFNDTGANYGGCPIGQPCGGISGNAAIDGNAQPSGGVVEGSSDSTVRFYRTAITGNSGKFVYFGNDRTDFDAYNVLITGNTVANNLLAADSVSDYVDLENTTITDNSIGATTVLRLRSNNNFPTKLHRSIIWQPQKTLVQLSGDPLDVVDDLLSEGNSIGAGNDANVIVVYPRFVDPAHGDYSLRAGSPAVDYTTSVAADTVDLYSNPRDVDLPIVANVHGKRDIGAIERQTLQPLVLNSDFDVDLRLWSVVSAGVTTWDVTRNASGVAGSGSAHITKAGTSLGQEVVGLTQCVALPGPGTYALNSYGRGSGTMFTAGDVAQLRWEYRQNGGEDCTGGLPGTTGSVPLSNSGSWLRPASPTLITVNAQDWTPYSTIAVTLVGIENGASGAPTSVWFDGATLSIAGDDRIFADGFNNP